jgi:hypothetical protein
MQRRLAHVFDLLGLVLEREPLQLALRALYGDDDSLRGTALEYLQSVLPEHVSALLWPQLEHARAPHGAVRRPSRAIVEELLMSMDDVPRPHRPPTDSSEGSGTAQ